MKRLRIWINSLNLLEQFLMISLLTILFFVGFFVTYVNQNIDELTDQQMLAYLRRSQHSFLRAQENLLDYEDTNAYHLVYSKPSHNYLSNVPAEIMPAVNVLDVDSIVENADKVITLGKNHYVYSAYLFEEDYVLLSFIKTEYRLGFREALLKGTVNITLAMMFSLFMLFMIWVVSLIRPLNQIRNYIDRLKKGDNVQLVINRRDEIGEVAEALKEMNRELNEQKHIREEMIQNISHDLKTPIATIKSYSESIKDGIYPYDTLEKSVDVIIEHADRLEKKVYSLIRYNKYGYLQDNVEGDHLLMSELISKAILSCRVLRNDVEIITDVKPEVCFHGEEEPWRVLVENLLENALRYAKTVVRITVEENLLTVYNDGELMDKNSIDKLFKPYEKGNKGNFGLGLSIVKRVAETYGYSVVGENRDDGVIFKVYRERNY